MRLHPAEIRLLRSEDGLRLFGDEASTPASPAALARLGSAAPPAWDLFSRMLVFEHFIVPNQPVFAFGWVERGSTPPDLGVEATQGTRVTVVDCSEHQFHELLRDRITVGIGIVLLWLVIETCLLSGLLVKVVNSLAAGRP